MIALPRDRWNPLMAGAGSPTIIGAAVHACEAGKARIAQSMALIKSSSFVLPAAMPAFGSGCERAWPGTRDANAGSGASFGPDATTRKPWPAMCVRKVSNKRPALEQAPFPHATIGSRWPAVNGDRSVGRYTVCVVSVGSEITDTA